MKHTLVPVVLCGGSGTRLWPLSRESYPKQFHAFGGGLTLLQDTVERLQGLQGSVALQPPILVCNVEHRFLVASQLLTVQPEGARIVLEPVGRNTAPALTLAALAASADGADPILLAMPADHVFTDRSALHAAIGYGLKAAAEGAVVTFGIVAERPETGYGYIRRGAEYLPGESYRVASFAEKPDAQTAQRYLDSGEYLWNSGLYMVRASVWLKALQACRPEILQACVQAMAQAKSDLDFVRPDAAAFTACPSDSIDYAVMERLPARPELEIPACVVPLQAGWSDLGAWDALWQVLDRDADDNAVVGDGVLADSSGTLVVASSRMVAGVGLKDIVIAETPDAVLVVDKSRTQNVKQIVAHLKAQQRPLADHHRKVHRPWGWYDSIDSGERFQVKRIVVNPGASLSLQMHHHRAEHWVVVKGTAQVTNGEKTFLLGENESTFIPVGHVHRLSNPGKLPLEIIEVQSGSYLGEDDIVRYDDTYGRTSSL